MFLYKWYIGVRQFQVGESKRQTKSIETRVLTVRTSIPSHIPGEGMYTLGKRKHFRKCALS